MRPLWQHQVDAIRMAETNRDVGLFWEMGTGKTRGMIEILRRRYAAKGVLRKTIIFAPIVVCPNWAKEFALYSKIKPTDIVVLTKSGKRRVKDFLDAVGEDCARAKIIVTNYEATQMDDLYKLLTHWKPEVIVCDESQRLKNPESKRAKLVAKLAEIAEHRYILTGTPILNSPSDVFMQFRILDNGETFGKNFFSFRGRFFEDKNAAFKAKSSYFPKWEPRVSEFPVLQDKIRKKAIRVLKKDCLDLPPLIKQEVHVSMSPEQTRMYEEMRKEFVTFVESKSAEPRAVVAQLAVTKALRLQQIVSGFAKDDMDTEHELKCPRLDALSDLLEDITPGNKVIVWAVFKHNYRMIAALCKKLGLEYAELHGDITAAQKQENIDKFRTDDKCRVMIANQSAGGVGINLIEAAYAIYYSKGFSLEHDLQSEARNYRGGSEVHTKVTRIDLVCRGTIDELVMESLGKKQVISDVILNWKDKL